MSSENHTENNQTPQDAPASILHGRNVAFGLQSATITVLVLCLLAVANFVGTRYPLRKDLTKNKVHTLAELTEKQVRELKSPIQLNLFSKVAQREQFRRLLESLRDLNPKMVKVDYVDPDREPMRARELNTKKPLVLQVVVGPRTQVLEEINEEKILNSLIKLSKEKATLVCALTGHGEKSFSGQDASGLSSVQRGLTEQTYETKEFNLQIEPKVPEACDVVALMGPTQAFLPKEVEALAAYLDTGGRALIALEPALKANDPGKDLAPLLGKWFVKAESGMILDRRAQFVGLVPLEALNKQSAITKDASVPPLFIVSRPLAEISGRPAGINFQTLASSSSQSWSETDIASLTSGKPSYDAGKDLKGPSPVAFAIEGKLPESKAPRNTRLIVLGSTQFANNQFARVGGNLDFALNSLSWLAEDERLISVRPREDTPTLMENKSSTMTLIFYLGWLGLPFLTIGTGVGVWLKRRRL